MSLESDFGGVRATELQLVVPRDTLNVSPFLGYDDPSSLFHQGSILYSSSPTVLTGSFTTCGYLQVKSRSYRFVILEKTKNYKIGRDTRYFWVKYLSTWVSFYRLFKKRLWFTLYKSSLSASYIIDSQTSLDSLIDYSKLFIFWLRVSSDHWTNFDCLDHFFLGLPKFKKTSNFLLLFIYCPILRWLFINIIFIHRNLCLITITHPLPQPLDRNLHQEGPWIRFVFRFRYGQHSTSLRYQERVIVVSLY